MGFWNLKALSQWHTFPNRSTNWEPSNINNKGTEVILIHTTTAGHQVTNGVHQPLLNLLWGWGYKQCIPSCPSTREMQRFKTSLYKLRRKEGHKVCKCRLLTGWVQGPWACHRSGSPRVHRYAQVEEHCGISVACEELEGSGETGSSRSTFSLISKTTSFLGLKLQADIYIISANQLGPSVDINKDEEHRLGPRFPMSKRESRIKFWKHKWLRSQQSCVGLGGQLLSLCGICQSPDSASLSSIIVLLPTAWVTHCKDSINSRKERPVTIFMWTQQLQAVH